MRCRVLLASAWISGALCLLAAAVLAVGWLLGYRLYSVQTGSMQPVLQPGDAVLVRANAAEPPVGSIVTYRTAADPAVLLTHRVIAVRQNDLLLQGDNATQTDPLIGRHQLVGTAAANLPGFGRIIDGLRTPLGLAAAVYAPLVTVVVVELLMVARALRRPSYRLR